MRFITESELNTVKGLIHYLNQPGTLPEDGGSLAVEAKLIDSNGEHVGTVTIHDGGEYGLVLPE